MEGIYEWIESSHVCKIGDSWSELLKPFELRTESAIVKYIFDTWIPYKEVLVSAWADRITHFGHTVTSRVKALISCWNSTCQLALITSFHAVESFTWRLVIIMQNTTCPGSVSYWEYVIIRPTPQKIVFQNINLKISQFTMNKIYEKLKPPVSRKK